jgi:uncharacterized phage-like protein YoqJ
MIIAVTGHRPPKLGGYWTPNQVYDAVKAGLLRKFMELQPSVVLTGMALGTDQWAAEVCLDNGIPYDAIVPFHGFENTWPDRSKVHFNFLLGRARTVHYVTDTTTYSSGLLQRRNQWLVDHSTVLVGVWNGSSGGTSNCITYARGRGKSVVLVDLPDGIWVTAATQEQIHTGRVAARQLQQLLPLAPPTAPAFRRRLQHTQHLHSNDMPPHTPTVEDLRAIYNEALHPEAEQVAPATAMDSIAAALRHPDVQRQLLTNILRTPTEPDHIPSPIKGDKQATPRKTGRIIDLDD